MSELIFEDNGSNQVAEINDSTYFSYNPHPHKGLSFFESDTKGAETAMVLDGKYYILNGDWRSGYIEAFKSGGMEACCRLFSENEAAHGSSWSTGIDVMGFLARRINNISKS